MLRVPIIARSRQESNESPLLVVGQFDVEAALRRHLAIPPCGIAAIFVSANGPGGRGH
jgi:hypothetical protein